MSQDIPILLYHSVSDQPPADFKPWAVGPEMFEEHLDMLVELGYEGLTIGQLTELTLAGRPVPERAVVVTFDDGFSDFASNAWPLMKARGVPTTLYVTAGLVGGSSEWLEPVGAAGLPILGAVEIGALSDDGVEIGAHSMTHPQLDIVGRGRAWREICDSKKALEAIVGLRVETFAYPHGYHDRATKKMVADAGFKSAAAVRNALSHAGDDRFALARYTVMADCTAEHLAGVLDGRHARRAPRRERLRTGVWREVRRFRARTGS
ncbi:polysaccharide deacetylase family protein [Paeniglutamicibacter kerguelensis]|uniref:Peptidoglycan/xylan/chitin deacetylase (PgdA/CDA1 family) n=1 Tax=Paeniglutamicibacter kerguelensis TaxID=254788 RepID=A0ABS4XED6_9MICC|nr:polysaccharide deacetylase family protein [Paeniglutamicibacter kerguelensis]MBP2386603.1 peptidoglycan/xylan/chitin deacetylase (PgdA/CDA1 family) [Paeniglutamicibacter kerguelensis]